MNTANIPAPISYETRVRTINDEEIHLPGSRAGDTCNLSTGEVNVARMVDGVRYDTAHATLIIGAGEYFGNGSYGLCRLYRTDDGKFFHLLMVWTLAGTAVDLTVITANDDLGVLQIAQVLLPDRDVVGFLRDWYCAGLLPIDDDFVKEWAESALPADECQEVMVALGNRYSPRADVPPAADA